MTGQAEVPPAGATIGRPALDTVLKLTALAGALIYGVLFLGYRSFYTRLAVAPEELGVTNTFVLVRSIGFILLMAALAAALWVSWFQSRHFRSWPSTRRDVGRFAISLALGAALALYGATLSPERWPWWVGAAMAGAVFLIGGVSGVLMSDRPRLSIAIVLSAGAVLTVVMPTAAVIGRADDLAGAVKAGSAVAPFDLFSVPVLDVAAVPARVTWIGPREQRPALFGSDRDPSLSGLLLGQAGGTVILAIAVDQGDLHLLRVPASSVLVVTQ
ncbi:MAG: hypothetical protein JWQ99_2265 [Blastococcus sp.]|jgi:hypothetical protein|nr:hypothetical protein [Blastococcus sp.]